jgi:glycerate 2-kinase
MYLKNYSELFPKGLRKSLRNLRKIGLDCIEIAIDTVMPDILVKNKVKLMDKILTVGKDKYNLNEFKKVIVIGGGKATAQMAFSIEKILRDSNIEIEGIINIPDGLDIDRSQFSSKIKVIYASHPIPNQAGLEGTKLMIDLIEKASSNDLILCLLSGGGSSLLPLPKGGITLDELQKVTSILLASGADIDEINTIRKHLSNFKGGKLAKKIYEKSNATLISLIISDVVGDRLDSIASGPSVPDLTTFYDSIDILKKYNIYDKVPEVIVEYLHKGSQNIEMETPKPNDPCFNKVHNYLIGSAATAAEVLMGYLNEKSFNVEYFSKEIKGEAKKFGESLHEIISHKIEEKMIHEKNNKIALIGTGELTVTIRGNGIGGRNQEMLLGFLNTLEKRAIDQDLMIIGANLDGTEGNSRAMGALIDNFVINEMFNRNLNPLEYLEKNDSNKFFQIVNTELLTGQTGCNVNDLVIILISKTKLN